MNGFKSCIAITLFLLCFQTGCKVAEAVSPDAEPEEANPDWTEESHSDNVSPGYAMVFPQELVNSIEIEMTSADWAAIKSDMASKSWGNFGGGGSGGGNPGQGGGGQGGGSFGNDPEHVAVTLKFNGRTWNNVGFRLKGNSSLSSIWRAGIYKLPFRLNMDKFEDDFPAIKNQRFYGFDELSMSPGFSDNSLLREKVTADIFRNAGIPAARTAFYKVYINFGAGLKYCGIYTMVEVIDDTMVPDQFGEDQGNIYKPESSYKTFAESDFEKKNNEKAADYEDVKAMITALNSSQRTSSPAQWREALEKTFDVYHFLKYLAVNNTIVNWDCYGAMAHNQYLFNSSTRKLVWIPWDFNMSMTSSGSGGNGGAGGGGSRNAVSLAMTEVSGSSWPLIRYLADDPVYYAAYKSYVKEFNEQVFIPEKINQYLQKLHDMIAPFVTGSEPEQTGYSNLSSKASFAQDLTSLQSHITSRNKAAGTFTGN